MRLRIDDRNINWVKWEISTVIWILKNKEKRKYKSNKNDEMNIIRIL